jgi:hypothetical protein
MADLDPIDRWYSEPLDVHVWSHHPEIRELTNTLYDELGIFQFESTSNNKPKISPKSMLRVLLLDLIARRQRRHLPCTFLNRLSVKLECRCYVLPNPL